MTYPMVTNHGRAFEAIEEERAAQDRKWGTQGHSPIEWMVILMEEVGEASEEALTGHFHRSGVSTGYEKELIQCAAVAVAALECLWRHKETSTT